MVQDTVTLLMGKSVAKVLLHAFKRTCKIVDTFPVTLILVKSKKTKKFSNPLSRDLVKIRGSKPMFSFLSTLKYSIEPKPANQCLNKSK